MQFPETYKFTCVSTGHIQQHDIPTLESFEGALATYPEGFFIWTGYAPSVAGGIKGLSVEVLNILEAAKAEGFDYVQFDSDGPELDEFPYFEW